MSEREGTHELLGDNKTGFELHELQTACARSVSTFSRAIGVEPPGPMVLRAEVGFVCDFYTAVQNRKVFGGAISAGDAIVINEFIRVCRPVGLYEIGVASGFSSLFLLSSMRRHGLLESGDPQLLSFDLLERHHDDPEKRVGQIMETRGGDLNSHWRLQTGKTTIDLYNAPIPDFRRGGPVVAFVDGGHCHPWPLIDVFVLLGRLPAGSWILMQDVSLAERLYQDTVRFRRRAGFGFRGAGYVFEHFGGRKVRGFGGCFNMAALQVPEEPTTVLASLKETLMYPLEHVAGEVELEFVERIRQAEQIAPAGAVGPT